MKKYICYDGVEGDISYHNTINEAEEKLRYLIETGIDDGEWMEGVEDSFIAEIKMNIKPENEKTPDDYFEDTGIRYFVDMNISEIIK